ncbi:MAG: hypothetical protein ACFCU5_10670 [Pleurocapsa sp.]
MTTYQEVRRQIESLTLDEQVRLMQELALIVSHRTPEKSKRNIMELEGLGQDIWRGFDAQEYVNRERQSWNG